jgi:hypothetical protein
LAIDPASKPGIESDSKNPYLRLHFSGIRSFLVLGICNSGGVSNAGKSSKGSLNFGGDP